jgi:hypothetical protein
MGTRETRLKGSFPDCPISHRLGLSGCLLKVGSPWLFRHGPPSDNASFPPSLQRRLDYHAPPPTPLLPLEDPDLAIAGYTTDPSTSLAPEDKQPSTHRDRKEVLFDIRQGLSCGQPMRELFQLLCACGEAPKSDGDGEGGDTDQRKRSEGDNDDNLETDRLVVAAELWNLLEGPGGTLTSLYSDLALDSSLEGSEGRMTGLAAKASRVSLRFSRHSLYTGSKGLFVIARLSGSIRQGTFLAPERDGERRQNGLLRVSDLARSGLESLAPEGGKGVSSASNLSSSAGLQLTLSGCGGY